MKKIEFLIRPERIMAKYRVANKLYFGIGRSEAEALLELDKAIDRNVFALYDMDAYTSMHNSSVRTRA